LLSGRPAPGEREGNAFVLPISLTPFGLAAFRVDSEQVTIRSYETEPMDEEELARLQSVPDRVEALLADPVVKLSLSLDDRDFMEDRLAALRGAIAEGEYARAWSLMTGYRFWGLWQDYLERAAEG
ncbi:MAG: hypothetical protein ACE5JM_15300, partial [Armatimonadota bacterium]